MKWTITSLPLSFNLFRRLLRACARQSSLLSGKKLYGFFLTTGLAVSPRSFLRNAVLIVYAACGEVDDARNVFDEIPDSNEDAIDWTTMMVCLARCGEPFNALKLFAEMRKGETLMGDLTLVCVFKACAQLLDVAIGKQGHGWMVKAFGCNSVKAFNALMDMYVKNGLMGAAKRVFDEWGSGVWCLGQ